MKLLPKARPGSDGVIAIINRLALMLALTITLVIPLGYMGLQYTNDADSADGQAQVKAGAITSLISGNPRLWSYQVQRMEELLAHYPIPIGEYRVSVYDARGARVAGAGQGQDWPVLERSHPLYDSGRAIGRVEITHSLRPLIFETALAALLGLLLGAAVYGVLWIGPLRALRRMELSLEAKHKELQTSEQRYRTVANFTYDWEYWLSTDRSLPYVSPSCLRITGYAASEFQKDPGLLSRIVHPDDREGFVRHLHDIESADANAVHSELDFRISTVDGEERWIAHICQAIWDEGGRYLGRRACNRDITARKRSEAKLQLAANVFDHAREGIIITDAVGTIIDINESFTRITGYSREEAIGQSPQVLKSDRQDKAFYEVMWRDLTEQGHWSGEIWNRRKDGQVYAELLTISSVRDDEGAVQQYVGLFSDITAIKDHQSQLEHIAHFDVLTGLPNRVLLSDRLKQAMAQAQRRNQRLVVVYLDLDCFKAINDQHGHDAGDQVLISLAQRLKQVLREGDSLARLGGDEFVAVLIDLEDLAAHQTMLTRMLEACAQPVRVGDLSLQVSASLGVTAYPQEHDIDADQLLRQADQAMYQAKLAGKNRYHIFDATEDISVRGHHENVERIRLALENHEFVLHFQPKVNMGSGQIIGAEALIRWQHPEKGLLAPALFLPVIENHALAVSIGEWVIDTALSQMEIWQAAGLNFGVSVNIGARQLQQRDFVDRLKSILAKHPQAKPANLELEVLETSALEDIAQVSQVIEACAQLGVTFALDDFGNGYSSLNYLKRLRVAMLKIDQSFVRDMLDDPDDLAILQGIIGLAAAFGREVIAEGVETIEHGNLLLQLGCGLAQGFGIARPMPATQMRQWAAKWKPDAAWNSIWSRVQASKGFKGIERRTSVDEQRIDTE